MAAAAAAPLPVLMRSTVHHSFREEAREEVRGAAAAGAAKLPERKRASTTPAPPRADAARLATPAQDADAKLGFARELASALQRQRVAPPAESAVGPKNGVVRDDAAALALRKPAIPRSSSSPCLSPSGAPSLLAAEAEAERFPPAVQPLGRLGRTRGVRRLLEVRRGTSRAARARSRARHGRRSRCSVGLDPWARCPPRRAAPRRLLPPARQPRADPCPYAPVSRAGCCRRLGRRPRATSGARGPRRHLFAPR